MTVFFSGSSPPWFATWGNFAEITSSEQRSNASQRWRNAKVKTTSATTFSALVRNKTDRDIRRSHAPASSIGISKAGFVKNVNVTNVQRPLKTPRKDEQLTRDLLLSTSTSTGFIQFYVDPEEDGEADVENLDGEELVSEEDDENEQLCEKSRPSLSLVLTRTHT
jgi:hypothetical protein